MTRSVAPYAVVARSPGRIVDYAVSPSTEALPNLVTPDVRSAQLIKGVKLDELSIIHEVRGNLAAREVGRGLPFTPKRIFMIFDVPSKEVRGEHAHKECHELLICVKGSVNCLVDNGSERAEFCLNSPEKALHIPPMVWITQSKYTEDAVLVVLASHAYDPDDYIRDYEKFLAMTEHS